MKKLLALAMSVVFGGSMFFAYAVPAMAGEYTMAQGASCPMPSFITGPSHDSGFLGALALDRRGNELGRVIDVTVGGGGMVNFLVVYSCLPGMNGKLVAIPVNSLDTRQSIGTVITGVTQEDFQKAPAISSQEWNEIGSRWSSWFQEDYRYFSKDFVEAF
jgi:hypothetical protein